MTNQIAAGSRGVVIGVVVACLAACGLVGCAAGEGDKEIELAAPETPVVQVPTEGSDSEPVDPLSRAHLPEDFRSEQERLLALAREAAELEPDEPLAQIWVGRRLAYLARYDDAIEWYTQALERFPDDPRLYRHRGHRYLTTRQFQLAIADLEHAAGLVAGTPDQVEPDGLPNERGIPTSTTQTNIWYHLGLAYYLEGRFDEASDAFRNCLELSENPDMKVATSYWLYLSLVRAEQVAESEEVLEGIFAEMQLIENRDYHHLLMVYKGNEDPGGLLDRARQDGGIAHATLGYGVGAWFLTHGDLAAASVVFQEVLGGDRPAAFGYLAAEADLARLASATPSD